MAIGNPRALSPYFRVTDGLETLSPGVPFPFAPNDPQRVAIIITSASAGARIGPIAQTVSTRGINVNSGTAPGYFVFHFREFGPVIGYTWYAFNAGPAQLGFWLVSYEPPTSIALP